MATPSIKQLRHSALGFAPLYSPIMAGCAARLDEINALADHSPGFVWRFQSESGNAAYLRPYDDDRILFNLSVWATPDDLKTYVYRTVHADMIRQRQQWFAHFGDSYFALWWIPAGYIPPVDEAKQRLAHLQQHGESVEAFGFRNIFPAPV